MRHPFDWVVKECDRFQNSAVAVSFFVLTLTRKLFNRAHKAFVPFDRNLRKLFWPTTIGSFLLQSLFIIFFVYSPGSRILRMINFQHRWFRRQCLLRSAYGDSAKEIEWKSELESAPPARFTSPKFLTTFGSAIPPTIKVCFSCLHFLIVNELD